ncbi:hypothetical protein ACQUY5_32630, partial [Bacillus cereus]
MRPDLEKGQTIVCTAEDCTDKVWGHGYCQKHYTQYNKHGELRPDLERGKIQTCTVDFCRNKHKAKGYCIKHYKQFYVKKRIVKEVPKDKECKVLDCKNPQWAKGVCEKHYKQKVTHGKLTPEKERNIGRICSVEWCDEKHHANG